MSPTNKTKGPDRDQYLTRRGHILTSPAHLVEIDLLRGGERPSLPATPQSPYYALVSRSQDRPEFGFWPIGMREPLPPLPIPLTPPDPEVSLDIQAVLPRVYDEANYGKYIYEDEPQPRLSADDAAWARMIVDKAERT